MTRAVVTRSESETENEGRRLAEALGPDDVVYLEGDLGAGKTCFARGVASGLGAAPRDVASPTFAILNEYAGESGRIVLRHLDLYRLADTPKELEVLGLPDSVAGAPVIVEWPSRSLEAVLPPTRRIGLAREADGAAGDRRIVFDR
ncbi:MAG TPA: tRNA (adenosine(37)-N6)-threonylcarbamoyltransferase complex ATPase subunit type 1 TsaE [Thermoanaerobaculia bacterium]|jgi:tRNA threonylcarbamoyladenosine biosynthesis protein TsaE